MRGVSGNKMQPWPSVGRPRPITVIREKSPSGGLHPFYKKTLPPVARCHPLRKTFGLCVVLFEFVSRTTRHVLSVTASLLQVYRGGYHSPKYEKKYMYS